MTTLHEAQPRVEPAPEPYRGDQRSRYRTNISNTERLLSGLGGTALMTYAARQRSVPALLLGLLGGGPLLYFAASGYCPGYDALGINTRRHGRARPEDFFDTGIHVEHAITIQKPPEELYRYWLRFENLPRFMDHLLYVSRKEDGTSHWVAKAPAGATVEWDAQIINHEENHLIAWRSLEGADVDHAGSVRFVRAPADRGTEVRVVLDYIPPAGRVGFAVAKLFGEEPRQQIQEDLRRFKQLMEAGEAAMTLGQPRGACL